MEKQRGRPPLPANVHRVHIGIRYDKFLIRLFDQLCARQGVTRNKGVDICIRAAIKAQRIPDSYMPDVDKMVEAEKLKDLASANTRIYNGGRKRVQSPESRSAAIE